MKICFAFAPYPHPLDHWLCGRDGHFAMWAYQARYYDLHLVVGGFEGTLIRDDYTIHGCGMNPEAFMAKVRELNPDALVAYGPVDHPLWAPYRQAAPQAFFALDYAGGPLCQYDGSPIPTMGWFDHIFTAHETQAKVLRDLGASASKARGVPLEWFTPLPNVEKRWRCLYPANFSPGKRNPLLAQVCEQYAPDKPSLFLGVMEHPAVIEMTRCGGIPLNKPGIPQRNHIHLGGRAPAAVMPLLYNSADIVVCPSQEEAGAWILMEALACGTPVIVLSDCQWGVAEAFKAIEVSHGPAVQVVDPWPEAIYRAMENALRDPDVPRLARLAAVEYFDGFAMYAEVDRVLKNGVAMKQQGRSLREVA